MLHSERHRRLGEPGRHHGPLDARGPDFQVRLRSRNQLQQAPRGERVAFRRRQIERAYELFARGRPLGRRHQVRWNDSKGREDGVPRRRSPRYRELHQLEGQGGTESRLAGRGLADSSATPQRDHEIVPPVCGLGRRQSRRRVRSTKEPRASKRGRRGKGGGSLPQLHSTSDPTCETGLHGRRVSHLRHGLRK